MTCVINPNGYKLIETNWITLYVKSDNLTYFDSFGVEYIWNEIKKFISNKKINNEYL